MAFIFLFTDSKDVSISLFMLVLILIFIIVCILLFALFRMYGKNQKGETAGGNMNNRKKGYLPAATSPGGGSGGGKNINSRLNNTRELKPPDLWIHHNEQVELKSMEKSGINGNGSESPVLSRHHDGSNSFAKIKKTNSTYGVNSSLYDDINKPPTSPTDNVGMSATMRRSSTIRPTKSGGQSGGTGCLEHALSNGIINMEPSTGLSRPMYPKSQFSALPRGHLNLDSIDHHHHHHHHSSASGQMAFGNSPNGQLHLYDPVSGPQMQQQQQQQQHMSQMMMGGGACGQPSLQQQCNMSHLHQQQQADVSLASIHIAMANSGNGGNSYMSGTSSSSPHSVISNNTVLTNSSTATNITNSSTSPPNTCPTSIYMSNKRPPGLVGGGGQHLKSFGVPTPPPPLPSLATLSSLQNGSQNNIYNSK